jgi:hypothetical protein
VLGRPSSALERPSSALGRPSSKIRIRRRRGAGTVPPAGAPRFVSGILFPILFEVLRTRHRGAPR